MFIFNSFKKIPIPHLIRRFIKLESSSSLFLFAMTVLAFILANSNWGSVYQIWVKKTHSLINEGLMSIFFLLVGLELKREFVSGRLANFSQFALPALCAIGGMIIPGLIYFIINLNHDSWHGFTIPMATDIAFSLGTLTLFGKRLPISLKLFLLTLAIYDDLGAIILISVLYTQSISLLCLALAAALFALLILLNTMNIRFLGFYLFIGTLLWITLLKSGIHPTLSGILIAISIPAKSASHHHSPLTSLEETLHPYVAYGIIPIFALANAGFSLQNITLQHFTDPIVLGIVSGLFIGKQIGIGLPAYLLIRYKWVKLPDGASFGTFYGVILLCGIGFTMSLFLGTLAFQNQYPYLIQVRLGVILGSLLSGLVGVGILATTLKLKKRTSH